MRFVSSKRQGHNIQRPTPNAQLSELSVEALNVERWALESHHSENFLTTTAGLPATTQFAGTLFDHHRARCHDGVFADCYAFEDDRIHADPDVVTNFHRPRLEFGGVPADPCRRARGRAHRLVVAPVRSDENPSRRYRHSRKSGNEIRFRCVLRP